jgi:hypothetical protein
MPEVLTSACHLARRFGRALGASCWLVGCGQLLDLPDNPRLVKEPAVAEGSGAELGTRASDTPDPLAEPRRATEEPEGPSPLGAADGLASPDSGTRPSPEVADDERRDAAAPDAARPAPEPEPVLDCGPGESLGPNGRCFIVVDTLLSWAEARTSCVGRGAGWDLGAVRSPALTQLMAEMIGTQAWIGASDADEEGTWVWVNEGVPFWSGRGDGVSLNGEYENWNSDEPNGRANSNCARLVRVPNPAVTTNPTWADLECFELLPALCEGPPR